MENRKSVAIIGAGIAGLSAGIYLRKAGLDVTVFESHTLPGGQCTSWERKGFTFDGCAHWVVGTREGRELHSIWTELGALDGVRVIDHDRYKSVSMPDGRSVTFYADPDRTEKELMEAAPGDREEIRRLMKAVRIAAKIHLPDPGSKSLAAVFQLLRSLPHFIRLWTWGKTSASDYSKRFTDPLMQRAILSVFAPRFSMLFFLFTMAWLRHRNAGYPVGGSLEFARRIEKRLIERGGEIRYRSPVVEILVENNMAVGVKLENGSRQRFDAVISASDGHATLERLLGGRYHNRKLENAWEILPPFDPLFYISLGINGTLEQTPSVSGRTVLFSTPVETSFGPVEGVLVHPMDFDPTLAPAGKSTVVVMLLTDWNSWKDEDRNSESYRTRKEVDARAIIEAVDREFYPGLRNRIEEMDVATPLTWVRYTGVYRGAFEGLQMTPDVFRVGMSLPKTLDGLSRFYLCGQWVEPGGGLPSAAISGRTAAEMLVREFRRAEKGA